MSDLKKIALTKAINTLASIGAIYTVEYEGETTSNAPKVNRARGYTRSGIKFKEIYQPAMDHLSSVGDFYELPCPEGMDIEQLRSALSASLRNTFGTKTTSTSVNKEKNVIEIVKV